MFCHINRYYNYESHVKDQITPRGRQAELLLQIISIYKINFKGMNKFIIHDRQLPVGRWEFLQVLEFD